MKTYLSLIVLLTVFLFACTSQKEASVAYDDVYYSSSDAVEPVDDAVYTATEVSTSSEYIQTRVSSDDFNYGGENTYSTTVTSEEEFEMDDYYDYSYTARIRRFHDPNPGYSYYDNYYTNNYYYDYDPWTYGNSIYSSYNYGYPYYGYGPSVSLSFGWGYPYYGYSGWGYPYYRYGWGWPYYSSWGYPYYGYGYGYGCCCNGYYPSPYYYNSYDNNSSYYGPRNNRGTNSNGTGQRASRDSRSFGEKYEDALAVNSGSRVARGGANAVTKEGSKTPRGYSPARTERNAQPARTEPAGVERQARTEPRAEKPQARTVREQPQAQRYSRPEQRYSKPKTYEAPNQRNTTSQRYTPSTGSRNDASRQSSQPRVTNNNSSNSRNYSTPSKTQSRSYTPPTRSNSRSYSTPSKSSSSPSRSSGSYSSPSRSSGSSSGGGSRSSGSGSSSSGSRGGRK